MLSRILGLIHGHTVQFYKVQYSVHHIHNNDVSEAATSALLLAWLFARPQGQMVPPDPAHQPSATALAHSTSGCWVCEDLYEQAHTQVMRRKGFTGEIHEYPSMM